MLCFCPINFSFKPTVSEKAFFFVFYIFVAISYSLSDFLKAPFFDEKFNRFSINFLRKFPKIFSKKRKGFCQKVQCPISYVLSLPLESYAFLKVVIHYLDLSTKINNMLHQVGIGFSLIIFLKFQPYFSRCQDRCLSERINIHIRAQPIYLTTQGLYVHIGEPNAPYVHIQVHLCHIFLNYSTAALTCCFHFIFFDRLAKKIYNKQKHNQQKT